MSAKMWEDYWNDRAERNALYYIHSATSTWNEHDFFKTGQDEIDSVMKVMEECNLDFNGQALDFGCGVGRLTFPLGKLFVHAIGTDISQVMIDKAKEYDKKFNDVKRNINFVKCSGEDLDILLTGIYSFVFSSIVLQHIEFPLRWDMRKELIRVLKSGGWMYVQDEVFTSHQQGYEKWLKENGIEDLHIVRENKESIYLWGRKK